jgi:hypothetical protein
MENRENELRKQLIMNQIPPPQSYNAAQINSNINSNINNMDYRNFDYYRDDIAMRQQKSWSETIFESLKFIICWK